MADLVIIDAPTLQPAQCFICSSGVDPDGFLNALRDIPAYGFAHICATCARQIGGAFGMAPADEFDEVVEELARTQATLDQTAAALEASSEMVVMSRIDLKAAFRALLKTDLKDRVEA